eukprot:TRINITY_DN1203_c0_g1_i13.p1 TRINITY_DN1203_c0_g1~~TRINITY_DN1203_c0_g1_i13.p1  ORF type:complete len:681 (-),score=97.74 TRINITY_DN1203_c0_g1_i13:352-2394(-)
MNTSVTKLRVLPGEADSSLGLKADWAPGEIFVKDVTPGSWAFQHGLRAGCQLCTLNGRYVRTMDQKSFVTHLKTRPLEIGYKSFDGGSLQSQDPITQSIVQPTSSRGSQQVSSDALAAQPAPVPPAQEALSLSHGDLTHIAQAAPARVLSSQSVFRTPARSSYGRGRGRMTGNLFHGQHSFADDEEVGSGTAAASAEPTQPEEEILEAGPLNICTKLEYASLKVDMAYNVFGLITLEAMQSEANAESVAALSEVAVEGKAKEVQDDQVAHVDITCVLDVSGSMKGAKIQLLKDAVMFVISELSSSDRLSIVSFESFSERNLALKRMSEEGKDAARGATMRLAAGGGTDIAAGLDCGIAVMEQRRQRNPVSAIFLLTDGQDSGVRGKIPGLVARARVAQSAIYTFGFGSDHDASIMSCISETAQTPFTFVERLENIREAFAGAVSGIMSVVAQNIVLTVEPQSGSEIVALHTHFSQQRIDDGTITVSIPDIFEGERKDVVVELRVPAATEGGTVLRSRASYQAIRARGMRVHTPPVLLEVARSEEPEAEPNEEVVSQRERVQVAEVLETAIVHGENGNFDQARCALEDQAKQLQSKKTPTDVSKSLLSDIQDAQRRLNSSSSWSKGGKAQLADQAKMHKFQRCTNLFDSEESTMDAAAVSSKSHYTTSKQKSAVMRSKAGY